MNLKKLKEELVTKAILMRNSANVPYSNYTVGAAVLTKSGKIYTGCNIENAAYTPSNCAERTAIFKAVSEGEREFIAIAISGGKIDSKETEFCSPCGVCRQVMREFCLDDFYIMLVKDKDNIKTYKLSDLLPEGFGPSNLRKEE